MEEEARPRKRGRPTRTDASSQPQPEPEPEARPEQSQPTKKKKRGRPSLSQSQTQAQSQTVEINPEPEPEPEITPPKRRGRPPRKGAPNATEPQETAAEEADDENEGNSSLLRRSGRDRQPTGEWYKSPRKSKTSPDRMVEDERTGEEPEEPHSPSRRRGRGRPSINSEEAASEAEANGAQTKGKKKKGPRAARNGNPTSEAEQVSAPNLLKKRVRRLAPDAQVVSEADADAEAEEEPQLRVRKKRGRPSLQPPTTTAKQDTVKDPKHKQTRSSLQDSHNAEEEEEEEEEPDDSQNKPKSRGRPPQPKDTAEEGPSQPNHKPRGRRQKEREAPPAASEHPSKESTAAADPDPDPDPTATSQPRKRKRPSAQSAQSSPEPEPEPKPYRELATQTRQVPLGIIETKWGPLDGPSIASVGDLLAGASRPVLLRLGDNPTRRAQAAAALNAVGNRLQSKIARGLPFPPPPPSTSTSTTTAAKGKEGGGGGVGKRGRGDEGRADELEYERTVAGIRNLEAALDPLLHSVGLLRRERERAQRELEREYRVLHTLGANARAQARERNGRLKRLHGLVPEYHHHIDSDYSDDDDYDGGSGGVRNVKDETSGGSSSKGSLFTADIQKDDPEIAGLAAQVADHMETMRGNLAQIDGVVPAIARSRALLVEALLPHLGREQLEDVMLG